MKPTLLVLAAGMGSRYGGLKQLDPVGPSGETIIDYSIFDAARAGFAKVVFVIRKDIESAFKDSVANKYRNIIQVEYAFQRLDDLPAPYTPPAGREKPWGTGQAILAARELIREPFAVINADDFYGRNSFKNLAECLSGIKNTDAGDFSMVGFKLRNTLSEHGSVSRGICSRNQLGQLISAEELTCISPDGKGAVNRNPDGSIRQLSGDEIVSLNMWGFTPVLFKHLSNLFCEFLEQKGQELKSEFYIPFAVNSMINSGDAAVRILETPDNWFGVTYREDKPAVAAAIQSLVDSGEYPVRLFSGE